MTDYASSSDPALAALFPTRIPDVEHLVYSYVKSATQDGLATGVPALSFYPDRARSTAEGLKIDVVRGWPAYPGRVPAIGVAQGPEGEDQQHHIISGGFAGDVVALDDQGNALGSASYYAQPLSSTILVELIHENRDERDRLHNELRRVLFPIRRFLCAQEPQIRQVTVDAEKGEMQSGPEASEQPWEIFVSVFTVAIAYEMLEATNVTGPESVFAGVDVVVTPADSPS